MKRFALSLALVAPLAACGTAPAASSGSQVESADATPATSGAEATAKVKAFLGLADGTLKVDGAGTEALSTISRIFHTPQPCALHIVDDVSSAGHEFLELAMKVEGKTNDEQLFLGASMNPAKITTETDSALALAWHEIGEGFGDLGRDRDLKLGKNADGSFQISIHTVRHTSFLPAIASTIVCKVTLN
jgi:hypothetical protein